MASELEPVIDQKAADVAEADAAERYRRQRQLLDLVGDAVRRADAFSRLDAALRYHGRELA